ncbi:Na+/H+ antiporter NhaA [Streptomyces sp. NPDC000880]
MVLLAATAAALIWANSPAGHSYATVWASQVGWQGAGLRLDVRHWVNDGLMAVFFFVIGLEIKRELVVGQLAHPRQALVPVLAAVGGGVVPAVLFLALSGGGPAARGWGVPMATDPAFAVGILTLVARRAPVGLRVLLLTIATVDDTLAVVVIAVGYSGGLAWGWLAAAIGGCVLVAAVRRLKVAAIWPYALLGVFVWYAALHSGVHATLAAVALALLTPTGLVGGRDVVRLLLARLAPISALIAVPVFALANAGVSLDAPAIASAARSPVTWAVLAGLVVGKFVGVVGAITLLTASGLGRLPSGVTRRHLAGLGLITGLGFTVALFVTGLAYTDPSLTEQAKVGILAAAAICAVGTAVVLAGQPEPAAPHDDARPHDARRNTLPDRSRNG